MGQRSRGPRAPARVWTTADWAGLAGLLLAAAALRLYHLDYGLPSVVYVDSFIYVGEAIRMVEPGDYVPRSFDYPAVFMDLLAGLFWTLDLETTSARHLAARLVASAASLLLLGLVYVTVRRDHSTGAAVIAGALVAACPVIVTGARTENTDCMLVLLMATTLVLACRPPRHLRNWLVVGLVAGLAVGTKYTGAFVLPFVALAALAAAWGTGRWRLHVLGATAALACAALVFAASTPWFFEYFDQFARAFENQLSAQRSGQIGRVQATAWDYLVSTTPTWEQPWLGTSLWSNLGPPACIAGLAALGWAVLGGGPRRRLEAVYVLLFLAVTCGAGRLKAIRYLMPILPVVYVLIGSGADRLLARLPDRPTPRRAATAALLILLAAYPAAASLRSVALASTPMTNLLARAWLEKNVPEGTGVFMSPLFVWDLRTMPYRWAWIQNAGPGQYRHAKGKGLSAERSPIFHPGLLDDLRRGGIEYLVLNSWFEDAFSPVPENLQFFPRSVAEYRAFRERLAATATLRWRVEGHGEGRLGPTIEVYQFN